MFDSSVIFHEKQEGRLCAQHCLNAALQGPYFTAVDLGELAMRLDEEERVQMTESENGIESEDYKQFLQQPSGNMDDTGYFSVQVITKALALWNLDLIPLNSTDTISTNIRQNPTHAQAYIFNMENHWFCIRRFKCIGIDDSTSIDGGEVNNISQPSTSRVSASASANPSPNTSLNSSQAESKAFFNLDSLLSRPSYMSSTYLTEYLRQMLTDGYSIFVISGMFPECGAEPLLKLSDIEPSAYIDLTEDQPKENVKPNDNIQANSKENNQSKKENQLVCSWSFRNRTLGGAPTTTAPTATHDENADLEAALRLSLECFGDRPAAIDSNVLQPTNENATLARLRDKRLAYFDALDPNGK